MYYQLCLLFLEGLAYGWKPRGHPDEKLKPFGIISRKPKVLLSRNPFPNNYCSRSNRCEHGEGDCDSNAECKAGLICGKNNCKDFDVRAHRYADCCRYRGGRQRYVYVSETLIMSLRTESLISCDQQFPLSGPSYDPDLKDASAGLVMHHGRMKMMVCGGQLRNKHKKGCHIWTKEGWKETFPQYDRYGGAASPLPGGGLLITGGRKHVTSTSSNGWNGFSAFYYPTEHWKFGFSPADEEKREHHCQVFVSPATYIMYMDRFFKNKQGSNKWTKFAPLNTLRVNFACVVWNKNEILAIGGLRDEGHNGATDPLSSIERYNTLTNRWSYWTPLPYPMSDMRAVAYRGTLYVMYPRNWGMNCTGNGCDWGNVWKLEPDTKKWKLVPGAYWHEPMVGKGVYPPVIFDNLHCK